MASDPSTSHPHKHKHHRASPPHSLSRKRALHTDPTFSSACIHTQSDCLGKAPGMGGLNVANQLPYLEDKYCFHVSPHQIRPHICSFTFFQGCHCP